MPTGQPRKPTGQPTTQPTAYPSNIPSGQPTGQPSGVPTGQPRKPTGQPSAQPSGWPTLYPSGKPTRKPVVPSQDRRLNALTASATFVPTLSPTMSSSTFPVSLLTQHSVREIQLVGLSFHYQQEIQVCHYDLKYFN